MRSLALHHGRAPGPKGSLGPPHRSAEQREEVRAHRASLGWLLGSGEGSHRGGNEVHLGRPSAVDRRLVHPRPRGHVVHSQGLVARAPNLLEGGAQDFGHDPGAPATRSHPLGTAGGSASFWRSLHALPPNTPAKKTPPGGG